MENLLLSKANRENNYEEEEGRGSEFPKSREGNRDQKQRSCECALQYHSTVINGGDCNCPITFGGQAYKEALEQSVRGANSTVEGVALQTWIRDNLLSVDSWYCQQLSVLTLTIECPGCDFVFASVFVLVLFGFQSEISKV